jgi:hypothetical protein
MFADDTSIPISSNNFTDLNQVCTSVLSHIAKWFQAAQLVLNVEKTNMVKFALTKFSHCPLQLTYEGKICTEADNIKFLGLQLDNHRTWKTHMDQLLQKLSTVCFIMRRLVHVLHTDIHRTVHFAYFHSLVKYGIVFWGNSTHMERVFLLQKRILRIMMGLGLRCPCKELFKNIDILRVPCLYFFFNDVCCQQS